VVAAVGVGCTFAVYSMVRNLYTNPDVQYVQFSLTYFVNRQSACICDAFGPNETLISRSMRN